MLPRDPAPEDRKVRVDVESAAEELRASAWFPTQRSAIARWNTQLASRVPRRSARRAKTSPSRQRPFRTSAQPRASSPTTLGRSRYPRRARARPSPRRIPRSTWNVARSRLMWTPYLVSYREVLERVTVGVLGESLLPRQAVEIAERLRGGRRLAGTLHQPRSPARCARGPPRHVPALRGPTRIPVRPRALRGSDVPLPRSCPVRRRASRGARAPRPSAPGARLPTRARDASPLRRPAACRAAPVRTRPARTRRELGRSSTMRSKAANAAFVATELDHGVADDSVVQRGVRRDPGRAPAIREPTTEVVAGECERAERTEGRRIARLERQRPALELAPSGGSRRRLRSHA